MLEVHPWVGGAEGSGQTLPRMDNKAHGLYEDGKLDGAVSPRLPHMS